MIPQSKSIYKVGEESGGIISQFHKVTPTFFSFRTCYSLSTTLEFLTRSFALEAFISGFVVIYMFQLASNIT